MRLNAKLHLVLEVLNDSLDKRLPLVEALLLEGQESKDFLG